MALVINEEQNMLKSSDKNNTRWNAELVKKFNKL